jgi:Protein of unknown function (DUF3455)
VAVTVENQDRIAEDPELSPVAIAPLPAGDLARAVKRSGEPLEIMKSRKENIHEYPFEVLLNVASLAALWVAVKVMAQVPSAIAVHDGTIIATLHAEGAQIHECKADSDSKSPSQFRALTWQFREPITTLVVDGKSIGRHYAGRNWDHIDGSGVKGKVTASAPGATPNDIPWLKLDVADHRSNGILSNVTTVQRINTKGGVVQGPCESQGSYRSVPYSADYVFLRKSD